MTWLGVQPEFLRRSLRGRTVIRALVCMVLLALGCGQKEPGEVSGDRVVAPAPSDEISATEDSTLVVEVNKADHAMVPVPEGIFVMGWDGGRFRTSSRRTKFFFPRTTLTSLRSP